jgi:hypothetical protein
VNFSFSGAAAVGIQRQRERTGVSALLGVHTTFLLHTPPVFAHASGLGAVVNFSFSWDGGGRDSTSEAADRSVRSTRRPYDLPSSHTPPGFTHASGLGAVVNFSFPGAAAVGIQRQRERTGVSALLGVHTTFLYYGLWVRRLHGRRGISRGVY